jgi:hypothetical protein
VACSLFSLDKQKSYYLKEAMRVLAPNEIGQIIQVLAGLEAFPQSSR